MRTKAGLKGMLVFGFGAVLALGLAGSVSATYGDESDDQTTSAKQLPKCDEVVVDGVRVQCPTNLKKTRIVQVFNPTDEKGTSTASACVCNATFVECDPNKTSKSTYQAATAQKPAGLPACNIGFLQAVPSEVQLLGNNTTYCETIGGSRICYTR